MAVVVQPAPKSRVPLPSKQGVIKTFISFTLIIVTFVVEPIVTRAIGISKPPKTSRLKSFLPGTGKSNLKWYQRLFTLKGWILNFRVSSEQWKSRFGSVSTFASKIWSSLGSFRYVVAIGALLLLGYVLYLLWQSTTVQNLLKPKASNANGQVVAPANGTVVKPASPPAHLSRPVPTSSPSKLGGLLPWKKKPAPAKPAPGTRFDVDAAYSSPEQASTSIIQDIRGAGLKFARRDIKTLLEVAFSAGKPIDDKKMAMEKVVAIAASLPPNSRARTVLTNFLTEGLWKSLQHPPLSYQGDKFEYRTPDGSFNNVLFPDLGKAGTPYARTCRRLRKLDGVRPDPGLLFDTLMGRTPGKFKENPAGLSSVLFYHASIIIHDIFRTNRLDPNISDTSSYLDLAPLYGSSLKDQLQIRAMEKGLLKPDTFHEKRLLGQPPGVNIMLVMYNRFHNYVAEMLLKINEGGRFTLPPTKDEKEKKKALAKQDNDLFQTARLIVGGLYINISLHDYLRGLTNTHATPSSWTIDPRVEIKKPGGGEVERGVGNQVSAEFNLLYRFHSIISQRDEKWLNDFLASLFPGSKKKLEELTPQELLQGLLRWEQNIHPDPSKREFDNLKRGPDGKFKDEDLVRLMTEAMESPAGVFGPRMVPKALRVVETLGILQARKWRMASLNEFRSFFGLKRYETMEDINPDPEIANLLRHLYDSPDMVELYPGLFIEETKPPMAPGNGGCLGYTAGRAVFSDAITLVRSDRFYTIDYTPATLTNWGMQEVQQDYNVMGGSMFYKLFQRALPGWYPYNSLHIMQPMYTWKKNKEIAEQLGTISQFTLAKPKAPPKPIILTKHATICKVLKNQTAFHVPWLPALNDLFPGKKDYSSFMLGGDAASNAAQRALVSGLLYGPADFSKLLLDTVKSTAKAALKSHTFELPGTASQINILKDIAIPVNAIIQGDLFSLDLHGPENPSGTLSVHDIYRHLSNVRTWGFNNNDPAMAFRRRLWAQESTTILTETTVKVVSHLAGGPKGVVSKLGKLLQKSPTASVKSGSLRWYGQHVVKELLAHGKTVSEAADIVWLTAIAGIGVPVGLFADVLQFFLLPQNADHWAKIQDIVAHAGPTSHDQLREYVLEAQRMTSRQRNLRVCVQDTCIDGQNFKKGEAVICLFGPACHDTSCIPDPQTFKPGRPAEAYIHFGHGPHECLGREIALTFCVGLIEVVAGLKNLRPAPGVMGELKSIQVGTEKCYLDDTWSWLTFDPTTWKLHFDGVGQGVCHGHSTFTAVAAGQDVNSIYQALQVQDQEGPTSVNIAGSKQDSLVVHSSSSISGNVEAQISSSAQSHQVGAGTTPQPKPQGQPTVAHGNVSSHGNVSAHGSDTTHAATTTSQPTSSGHGQGTAAIGNTGHNAASGHHQGAVSTSTAAKPSTLVHPQAPIVPSTAPTSQTPGQAPGTHPPPTAPHPSQASSTGHVTQQGATSSTTATGQQTQKKPTATSTPKPQVATTGQSSGIHSNTSGAAQQQGQAAKGPPASSHTPTPGHPATPAPSATPAAPVATPQPTEAPHVALGHGTDVKPVSTSSASHGAQIGSSSSTTHTQGSGSLSASFQGMTTTTITHPIGTTVGILQNGQVTIQGSHSASDSHQTHTSGSVQTGGHLVGETKPAQIPVVLPHTSVSGSGSHTAQVSGNAQISNGHLVGTTKPAAPVTASVSDTHQGQQSGSVHGSNGHLVGTTKPAPIPSPTPSNPSTGHGFYGAHSSVNQHDQGTGHAASTSSGSVHTANGVTPTTPASSGTTTQDHGAAVSGSHTSGHSATAGAQQHSGGHVSTVSPQPQTSQQHQTHSHDQFSSHSQSQSHSATVSLDANSAWHWFFGISSERDFDVQMPHYLAPPPHPGSAPSGQNTSIGSHTAQGQTVVSSSEHHAAGHEWFFPKEAARDHPVTFPEHLKPPTHEGTTSEHSTAHDGADDSHWFFTQESHRSSSVAFPDHLRAPDDTLHRSPTSTGHETESSSHHAWFFPPEAHRDAAIKVPEECLPPPLPGKVNGDTQHPASTPTATPDKKPTSSLVQAGTFSTKELYSYPQTRASSTKPHTFPHAFTSDPSAFVGIRSLDLDRRHSHSVSAHVSQNTHHGFTANVEAAKDTQLYRCDIDWMFAHENNIALGWWDTGANRSASHPITTETISFKFDKPFPGITGMLVVLNGIEAEGTSGGATSLDISARATSFSSEGCTIEVHAGPGCKLHRAKGHWLAYTSSSAVATGTFNSGGKKRCDEHVKFGHTFETPPKVLAGLNKVKFDISQANVRCLLEAKEVTKEGFKWEWVVWADSVTGVCEGVYVALDQKLLSPH